MEYNPTNIFQTIDLDKIAVACEINCDIIVRGEHLKSLGSITKINGFLGISDSSLESLGNLREIIGDFWTSFHTVYSPLKSLEKIEKIGGDATFRYSNITCLGKLKYVGGKLSLRDTQIESLGNIEYIGGDLYLPKRLKNLVDLENIYIVGKIKFWNDSKNIKAIKDKSSLDLIKTSTIVPYWQQEYIFSIDVLNKCSYEQGFFYKKYKESFANGVFIDIEGNDNYAFTLFYDLIQDYYGHKDINQLIKYFKELEKYYPKTANYTSLSIIEEFEKKSDFISAWVFIEKSDFISIQTVWKYQQKNERKLINGNLIVKLGGYSHLTEFGQKNIESIKPFSEKYLSLFETENKCEFLEMFFDNGIFFKEIENGYSPDYYHKFYLSESEYHYYKSLDDVQNTISYDTNIKHVVEKAVLNQLRLILKKSEDLYREEIGMPKIGEGWISETELFYKIKDVFANHEVLHHGNPEWLGRQHLDIYFPILNIGIEYQGLQHYEPVEYFGGKEAFERNLERDEKKRMLCKSNSCALIYVNEKYDFESVVKEIKEKIQKNKKRTFNHNE
jgi:hypothetical protein